MFGKIEKTLATFAAAVLAVTALVTGLDALCRNFFDSPITGSYVLVEDYLMPLMIFLMLGFVWARKEHVGISLLRDRMPFMARHILEILDRVIGLMVLVPITYVGSSVCWEAYADHDLTSGLISWPIWLALVSLPVGCGLFCIRLIGELAGHLVPSGWKKATSR